MGQTSRRKAEPTTEIDVLQLLADLAEQLSIEMLSEFTTEDYQHLGHTMTKLQSTEKVLASANRDIPFPVQQVLQNYRRAAH
jgi:hypothetical protein